MHIYSVKCYEHHMDIITYMKSYKYMYMGIITYMKLCRVLFEMYAIVAM